MGEEVFFRKVDGLKFHIALGKIDSHAHVVLLGHIQIGTQFIDCRIKAAH